MRSHADVQHFSVCRACCAWNYCDLPLLLLRYSFFRRFMLAYLGSRVSVRVFRGSLSAMSWCGSWMMLWCASILDEILVQAVSIILIYRHRFNYQSFTWGCVCVIGLGVLWFFCIVFRVGFFCYRFVADLSDVSSLLGLGAFYSVVQALNSIEHSLMLLRSKKV